MRTLLILVLLSGSKLLLSQEDSVAYSASFVLNEGIYVSHESFLWNKPIPIKKLKADELKGQPNFLEKVLAKEKIVYENRSGEIISINTDSLWGYCQNQNIYLILPSYCP